MTKLSQLVEALLLLVFAGIVLNLNVTIVLEATSDCWFDDRCTLDLTESMSRGQSGRKNSEEIVDMGRASPLPTSSRFFRKGNVEAV